MHYAAAARDGGHYLKILGKAGSDSMAVDNVCNIFDSTFDKFFYRKVEHQIIIVEMPFLI